jgi:hypothetical protein
MTMDIIWFDLDTTWQLGILPSIATQTSGGNPMRVKEFLSQTFGVVPKPQFGHSILYIH